MGNKVQNKQINNEIIQHQRLGLIKLIQNPIYKQDSQSQYPQLIQSHNYSLSFSQYKKWQELIAFYKFPSPKQKLLRKSKSQKQIQNKIIEQIPLSESIKDVIFLPIQTSIEEKGFCGGACDVKILYPNYSIILRNQISSRYIAQKCYSQTQIWYLLYNLILLERFLQPYERRIGNVHPNNVLINQEDGVMKIIIGGSIPKQKSGFSLICESQLQDVFLAPEQIDYTCIEKCRYPIKINQNLAQIFSIGMTVLQAGTLQLSTYIYDRGPYRINQNKLRLNINIFRARYGAFLSNILQGMLCQKPTGRRTSQQIYEVLSPYQNEILNLQTFTNKMTNNLTINKKQSYSSNQSNSILDASRYNNPSSLKSVHNDHEVYRSKFLGQPNVNAKKFNEKEQKSSSYAFNSTGTYGQRYNATNLIHRGQELDSSSYSRRQEFESRRIYSPRVKKSTFTN